MIHELLERPHALAGHAAVGVIGALCLHALFLTIGAPHRDFWAVLPNQRFLINLSMCAAALGIPLYILACVCAIPTPWRRTTRRQREAGARTALVAPFVTFIPLLAWLPFGVLCNIGSPSLGIGASKPAWTGWSLWPIAGSPYWLIALAAFFVFHKWK